MMLVADNLQILRPSIQEAMARHDPEPIARLIRQMEEAGAEAVDLNAGPCRRHPEREMTFLVQSAEAATRLPLFIDTASPQAMAAGVRAAGRPPILNGFSLEPRKLGEILPLAADHGLDIIGYLLDADGHVPPDAQGRLSAGLALFDAAAAKGLSPERIIVDPVVPPLSWQDGGRQMRAVIETLHLLPDLLGRPVRTVAGLSNLTSGAPSGAPRQVVESAFLAMMAAAGLSITLLNVFHTETMNAARACRALISEKPFSWAEFGSTAGVK